MSLRARQAEWQSVVTSAQRTANGIGYGLGRTNTLRAFGDVDRMQNQYSAAREAYVKTMHLFEQIGSRLGQANTFRALGDLSKI
jgi:hypothetical protein